MEQKVTIVQPYCVMWHSDNRAGDKDVMTWIRENVVSKLEIIQLGSSPTKIVIRQDGVDHCDLKTFECLFLFECPRDALLFKLTWGGK